MNNELLKKIELEEKRFFDYVFLLYNLGLLVEVDDNPEFYDEKCWATARQGGKK